MSEKKLLIIHQGALGDFVMTFPMLIGFRKTHSQIDAICQKKLGELVRKLKLVDTHYALESATFAPLYSDHPDQVEVKTATLLKSYERIALFSFSRKLQENIERIAGPKVLRIPPRPPVGEKIHVSRFLYRHLVKAGLLKEGEPASRPSSAFKRILPQQCRREPKSAPVLIHPGSGSRKKNWPLKNFILLEKMLRKDDLRTEFILGPADVYLRESLMTPPAPGPTIHITDDLLQVFSLTTKACGFIGNDSGLSHLAAFIGLPTVAVFGPSDPVRWEPVGRAVVVVTSDAGCEPCHESEENTCESMDCFKGITPRRVYSEFANLIRRHDRDF